MNKILTFIVNEYNEILLLKENPEDSQHQKSFWYVVTGGCEEIDKNLEDTVKREVYEETSLIVQKCIYLNLIFLYNSLGIDCIEYVYISFVKKDKIKLNEEFIDYKWCNIDEFLEEVYWFGERYELKNILTDAINKKIYLKVEKKIYC